MKTSAVSTGQTGNEKGLSEVVTSIIMMLIWVTFIVVGINFAVMGYTVLSGWLVVKEAAQITADTGSGDALATYVPRGGGVIQGSAEDYFRQEVERRGFQVGVIDCGFPGGNAEANSLAVCEGTIIPWSVASNWRIADMDAVGTFFGQPLTVRATALSQTGQNPNVQ